MVALIDLKTPKNMEVLCHFPLKTYAVGVEATFEDMEKLQRMTGASSPHEAIQFAIDVMLDMAEEAYGG